MPAPDVSTLMSVLTRDRLVEIGRAVRVSVPASARIESEPPELEDLYRVTLRRLEPVGLVYLWPTTR